MKRNLNESSTRSTAGCLPVPLFNQKKRTRQPLTSNPLKNDPGISTTSDSYDFPPLPTGISSLKQLAVVVDPGNLPGLKFIDFLLILEEGMDNWAWEAVNPELPPSTTTMNTGQIPCSVSHPSRTQDSVFKSTQLNTDRNKSGWSYRDGNKNTSLKTWYRNDFRPQCKRTNLVPNDGINSHPMNLGVQQQKQLTVSQSPNLSHQRQSGVLRQTHSSKTSGSTMRGLDKDSASQSFMSTFQKNQFKKKKLDDIPEENSLKNASLYQLKFKEKENSLRIISAVIESMKYWREHAPKTVLLFEILAVLDSAVTPGPYYSKTFLMRDGKNTLPCIFYEIDRELPRLIRGRVYRCVGNYDQKKNIFKCVSVRPASVSEQKTFQAFVKIVDAEMKYYTNVMNEM